jgi:hypothetical protein
MDDNIEETISLLYTLNLDYDDEYSGICGTFLLEPNPEFYGINNGLEIIKYESRSEALSAMNDLYNYHKWTTDSRI